MENRIRALLLCLPLVAALLLPSCARRQGAVAVNGFEEWEMVEPERIAPELAYRHMRSGDALLICAYDDAELCGRMQLPNSMTLYQFERSLMYIPVEKELIFYCA